MEVGNSSCSARSLVSAEGRGGVHQMSGQVETLVRRQPVKMLTVVSKFRSRETFSDGQNHSIR